MFRAARGAHAFAVPAASQRRLLWARFACGLVALLAAVGTHLTWWFFVNTAAGQAIDRAAFEGAQRHTLALRPVMGPVLANIVVVSLCVLVFAMAMALIRRQWYTAGLAGIAVTGANFTTQWIKDFYERPRLLVGWTGSNSLPSGHTTLAASVSIALVFAAPARWRPIAALVGAAWTLLTGLATLVGQWHRPADVVAAMLVVGAWAAAACAAMPGSVGWAGAESARQLGGVAVALGFAVVALVSLPFTVYAVFALTVAGGEVVTGLSLAFAGGVAAIVSATCGVFAAVLLLLRLVGAPGVGNGHFNGGKVYQPGGAAAAPIVGLSQ